MTGFSIRRRANLLTLSFVMAISQIAAAQDLTRPLKELAFEDGDQIVFLGDSITHQCLYTQYVEDFFYTRYPHLRLKFHNSGVGGAQAWDALQRFDEDVAAYKPRYVTVLLGMNDGRYQPFDQEIFDTYHEDMTKVVQKITALGATPVLMTPTMFDSRAARMRNPNQPAGKLELYNSVLAYYGTWLREVAVEGGYGFVDMYSLLNNITIEQRKTDPAFTMIKDSVHPGPSGQLVMAYALIEGVGLRKSLSNIRITIAPSGKSVEHSSGGQVTDLTVQEDGLSFTWNAEGLPWVLPAEAQEGAKLLHLGHRASREAIEIHGLKPGNYDLLIDDQVVGTYSSTVLSRHVELQSNERTPQYQQALAVAELNRKRNSEAVRKMRNEWYVYQTYARTKRALAGDKDNGDLQKKVADMEQKLEGLPARVAKLERSAREMEDRIFELNQPQSRQYVLRRKATN